MAVGDVRWGIRSIVATLFGQLVVNLVILGLSVDGITSNFVIVGPLGLAALTTLSLVVHIICFYTGSLHPLVVLTLAIESMILWLAGSVLVIIVTITDSNDGCRAYDGSSYSRSRYSDEDNSEYEESKSKAQNEGCKRSIAVLVLCVVMTLSYIWLVTYSAIVRKRTRMPYVPAEKRPLLQAEEGRARPPMGTVVSPAMAGAASAAGAPSTYASSLPIARSMGAPPRLGSYAPVSPTTTGGDIHVQPGPASVANRNRAPTVLSARAQEAYAPSLPTTAGGDLPLQPGAADVDSRTMTVSPVSTAPEAVHSPSSAGTPPPVPKHRWR